MQRVLILTGHCCLVSIIPSSKASSMLHFIIDHRVSSFITSLRKCPLVHFLPFANVRSRVGRAGQTSFSQLVCKGLSISAKKQVLGKEAKSLHIPFVFCKGHCPGCRQMSGRLHLRLFTPRLPTDGFTKFYCINLISSQSLHSITRGSQKLKLGRY